MPAFDTPSGLPLSMVNLAKRVGVPSSDSPTLVSTAEVSTLQLEFRYLSYLTDNDEYWQKAENVRTFCEYSIRLLVIVLCVGHECHQECSPCVGPCFDIHEVEFSSILVTF